MLKIEKKYWGKGIKYVAGIDEAGRGPLAGPVVAASVIFKPNEEIKGIKDSKKLTDKKRKKLYSIIYQKAIAIGIGIVHENKIDEINILKATFLAMNKAIGTLDQNPEQVLVDGPCSNVKLYPVEHVVNGDNISQSIAAASIIAKVTRDNMMVEYDKIFPEYGFAKHKGYGTKYHMEQINLIKSSPIHRKSFKIINKNLPDYKFFESRESAFPILGNQIVASEYIKKGYVIIDDKIECNNSFIDYCFLNQEKTKLLFIKTFSIYNNIKSTIDKKTLLKNNKYISCINEYIEKNNCTKKYTFNVISITFLKSKKPIIQIYKNA